ncbi:MAG: 3'-5' exonuclease, partial [Elusimicrobiota bacterium]
DALNLLRAIDDPGDKAALAGLLRSPLSGTDDRELYRLARAGLLDYRAQGRAVPGAMPFSSRERDGAQGRSLPGLYAKLRTLHAQAGRIPVADLVRRAFEETGFVELAAEAYHHQQTASNLWKLQRIAFSASEKGWTLKEFIAHVETSVRTLREEGESPLADERLDAVRVMTIHKAKGLEYPVVFLANLSGTVPGGAPDAAVFSRWSDGAVGLRFPGAGAVNAAWAVLAAEEARKQRAEEARVLYVAMTRPKERLFLLGGSGKSSSFSSLLERSGALQRRAVTPALPSPAAASVPAGGAWEPPRPGPFARAWERRRKTEEELAASRLFLAPSAEGEGEAPPRRREAPRGAGKPGFRPAESRLIGKLCHAALERWDFSAGASLEGESLAELIERRAALLASGPRETRRIARECRLILESFLRGEAARKLARAEILGREVPFVHAEGGRVVRGTMDLLYRLDGAVVVADYKTEGAAARRGSSRERGYA